MAVLTEDQRRKWDESNDDLFYAEPRFVQHLDEAFRRRLTQLYRQRIPPCAVVLDLMSSWHSHLPAHLKPVRVVGLGMNAEELDCNEQLHETIVHDLNATILHLLGLEHTQLTFRHNGIDRRLTDVHGHVIQEILQ